MNKEQRKLAQNIAQNIDTNNVDIYAAVVWKALQKSGGISKLDDFIDQVREYFSEYKGLTPILVTSSRELSGSEKLKLISMIENEMGKNNLINFKVKPNIIGGLVIKIKDEITDDSWKGRLDQLKAYLVRSV